MNKTLWKNCWQQLGEGRFRGGGWSPIFFMTYLPSHQATLGCCYNKTIWVFEVKRPSLRPQ